MPVQSISCQAAARARLLLAGAAMAATAAWAGEPSVPYVPTPQEVVEKMLEIAKVGPNDYVIDLGSGDGRIVITAARKFGARGFGVDLNPERIRESNENARKAGVTDRVSFQQRDLFETDLSEATVITMYLLPRVNMELRPKLLQLKPGTRIVSHDFSMEDWKPDAHVTVDAKEKYGGAGGKSDVYFWIVPAQVAGIWRWELPVAGKPQSYEVVLDQKFQVISGTARVGGRAVKLQRARLTGGDISLAFTAEVNGVAVRHELDGKVEGDAISGLARISGTRIQGQFEWNARRAPRPAAGRPEPHPRLAQSASRAFHR
ncbi:MAG TPA: methyltransferase domain-containing protein [Burkholderiales bacterium]|nr:methyltransferase domain-containing protein [Burkholderiales bacterium]